MILKRLTKLPWVAFVHGWTSENFKMKCYNAMDKFVLGFADNVVLVSQSLEEKLNFKWINKEKVITIPNAVDPAEFLTPIDNCYIRQKHNIAPDDPLVGVIGRFSPEKGHQ